MTISISDGELGLSVRNKLNSFLARVESASVTKTADFAVAATETWLINNKAGSNCTVTLPAAASNAGRFLGFKNLQAFTVVSASANVVPYLGGAASTAILPAIIGSHAFLVSDGTNWVIVMESGGGGGGGVSDGDKGHITVASGGTLWTIDSDVVNNSKLANMANGTIKGRVTAGTGDPEDLTATQVTSMLDIATAVLKGLMSAADKAKLDAITGTNTGDQTITLTGNVTGSGTGTFATTIGNGVVTNPKLADMPEGSIKLRQAPGGGAGPAQDFVLGALRLLGSNASGTPVAMAMGTGLEITGGNEVKISALGVDSISLAPGAVTNPKLADMASGTIKGRSTVGVGDPEDLTGAQATALLDVATTALKGLVPAPGTATGKFLKDDMTWAAPGGGGATNLSYDAATRVIASDTGTDATLPLVVAAGDAGLMTGADKTKLDAITGTNTGDQTITLTGDVTGSGTGSFAATVAGNAITNAKLADVATSTIKGRVTAGTGDPEDLTPAQVRTLINVADGANNYVHPNHSGDVTSVGDGAQTIATGAVTLAKMADIATDRLIGRDTAGTGVPEAITVGGGLEFSGAGGIQTAAFTGDATKAAGGTALTLATVNGNVGSFGLAASVAQFTVNAKGLITAAANTAISVAATAISDSTAAGRAMLTAATAAAQTALLDTFTSTLKGLVPASGGGTTNYLRADGTWAVPPGSGGGSVTFVSGASGAAGATDTRQVLAADASAITVTSLTDVLSLTGVGAGTWNVEVHLRYQSAATTTGLSTAINHSGTVTSFVSQSRFVSTGGAAATGIADQVAATNAGQLVEGKAERALNTASSATAGVDTLNADMYLVLNATMIVTVSGTLAFRVASEVAASGITPKAGTHMILRKIA